MSLVKETVDEYAMIKQGDRVLVGLSGGADSMVLLHLLLRLKEQFGISLGVCHLDHGLRGKESDRDALFTKGVAGDLGLPFYMERGDVKGLKRASGLSLEAAAREVRYEFYRAVAKAHGYNRIALGHHGDDNAELILMNLIRGTGPRGLSGIPPVRDGWIVRPLIRATRAAIEAFMQGEGISHVYDSSNADPAFLRNRVRSRLLPELERDYNPAMTRNLNRLSAVMAREEAWLDGMIEHLYEAALVPGARGGVVLSISRLHREHPAAIRRILRRAAASVTGNMRGIFHTHLDAVVDLMGGEATAGSLDLPGRIRVRRKGERLLINREARSLREVPPDPETPGWSYAADVPEPGGTTEVLLPEAGAVMRFSVVKRADCPSIHDTGQHAAFFDMVGLCFPLIIRNFMPGDRFTPLGMKGTQKVKSFFINSKVSKSQRAKCPLLVSEGEIVWIAGHRMSERFKVGPFTEKLLRVELLFA